MSANELVVHEELSHVSKLLVIIQTEIQRQSISLMKAKIKRERKMRIMYYSCASIK